MYGILKIIAVVALLCRMLATEVNIILHLFTMWNLSNIPTITLSLYLGAFGWEGLTSRVDAGPRIVWSRDHSHVSKTCN